MKKRDFFQYQRAIEARAWLSHPDRVIENLIDRVTRAQADKKAGHSINCSLTSCSIDCKKGNL
jgi:hypothetical protein